MSRLQHYLPAIAVIAYGALASAPAAATFQGNAYTGQNAASACQLSIPTTSTQVRPKANGYRNESTTTSAFVICGYTNPTAGAVKTFILRTASMDGTAHTFNCTGVVGNAGTGSPQAYATKAITTTADGMAISTSWAPADFGIESNFGATFPSVTCTLPPQVAIISTVSYADVDFINTP